MTLPHNTYYWHCHHEVLFEFVDNPQERIDYIKGAKPNHEIEIRLRLFQPVKGELPLAVVKAGAARDKAGAARGKARAARDKAWAAYVKAGAAYVKAGAAYGKARAAYVKAEAACVKVIKTHSEELEALHAKECLDCPWDGKTIFPEEEK